MAFFYSLWHFRSYHEPKTPNSFMAFMSASPGLGNWLDGRIGSAQFRVRGRQKEHLFGLNSRRPQLKKLGRFTLRLRQTNNHPSYCNCSWSELRKFKPVHTNSWKLCFEIEREYLIASLYTTEADRQCERSLSKKRAVIWDFVEFL